MKLIVLQKTYYNGKSFNAGEAVEFADDVAARMMKANLAHPAEPAENGQGTVQDAPEETGAVSDTDKAEPAENGQGTAKKAASKSKGKAAKKK